MPDLKVQNVTKEFPTPSGPLRILDGLNLALETGGNVAVIGPSGCGKSTLLHIIAALDAPTSGTVTLGGQNPHAMKANEQAAFRNAQIGFIFQEHHLLPQLPAIDNVVLPVMATRSVTKTDRDRAMQLLGDVGLADRATHLPGELSGGERQRVAVARALICAPKLLLADEPTGSLDESNAESVGQMLLDVQKRSGAMLVCVTHSAVLAGMFDKRMRLSAGKLIDA
jgi:lipoprotein-releasing system ATP-binding protein